MVPAVDTGMTHDLAPAFLNRTFMLSRYPPENELIHFQGGSPYYFSLIENPEISLTTRFWHLSAVISKKFCLPKHLMSDMHVHSPKGSLTTTSNWTPK